MFTFTNKEKQVLLNEVDSLKKELKECKDNSEINLLKQKIDFDEKYYRRLDGVMKDFLDEDLEVETRYIKKYKENVKLQWELEISNQKLSTREDYMKLLEQNSIYDKENTILKAQNSVLSKLQDKEDEYRDTIHKLELQLKDKGNDYSDVIKTLELDIADKTARIELLSDKSLRDEKEITELKLQLKEANDRIFEFTTKEPIIVRPEAVNPIILETKETVVNVLPTKK